MDTRDKTGLWADEKLGELYWKKTTPIQRLQEWALNLLIPRCSYKHWETGAICHKQGVPCWLPNYTEDSDGDQVEWVCYEHMHIAGYCKGCHQFWAGCEDFEFDPNGLCSNCRHNPDYDDDYGDEDWEELPDDDERDEDIAPGDYGYYS